MTSVSSSYPIFFVCHKNEAYKFSQFFLKAKNFKKICIFEINSEIELTQLLFVFPQHFKNRYLDRYYIDSAEEISKYGQELIEDFFEYIAINYESLINVDRNTENIKKCFYFLEQQLGSLNGLTIADYGCGTGISHLLAKEHDLEIVGIEPCQNMRRIAAARKMNVWSIKELTKQAEDSFDGAFASYVLHLLYDTTGIRLLWSRLKSGGVFIGNFHKNREIASINNCILELNGSILQLENNQVHGTYFAYIKR